MTNNAKRQEEARHEERQFKRLHFYDFWSWQYSRRNKDIIRACDEIKKLMATREKLNKTSKQYLENKRKLDYDVLNKTGEVQNITGFTFQDIIDVETDSSCLLLHIAEGCNYTYEILDQLSGSKIYTEMYVFDKGVVKEALVRIAIEHKFYPDDINLRCITFDPCEPFDELIWQFTEIVRQGREARRFRSIPRACVQSCSSNNRCDINNKPVVDRFINKTLAKSGVSFNANKQSARAIGLVLWDHMDSHGGTIENATDTLREKFSEELENIHIDTTDGRTFRHMHARTNECIQSCEVLSFK